MRFMVIRKADADTEASAMPSQQLIEDMTSYNEQMVKAGVMKEGNGLHASRLGARVSFKDGRPTILDGPFAEAKELIAGYSILEAPSIDVVLDWVKKWPQVDGHGNVQLEIRQVITAEDLGFNEEQIARERKVREMASQQQQ
jgi:hypothetical protein